MQASCAATLAGSKSVQPSPCVERAPKTDGGTDDGELCVRDLWLMVTNLFTLQCDFEDIPGNTILIA